LITLDTHAMLTWEHRDPDATVLFVTNLWPDAERPVYGIFVERQIRSLIACGLKCDVLYVRGYLGQHVYLVAALRMLLLRRRYRHRYRLVHAHAGESALVISGLYGMPLVASYCGDDLLGHPRNDGSYSAMHKLRRLTIQQQARLMTATITKSAEMGRMLPPKASALNHVVPNGVNQDVFRPIDRTEARHALGWPDSEKIVLFAATRPYETRKRLDLARAAVGEAERTVGPIRLMIAENQSPDQVPFLMNASDCLLLTSISEGSPNVVKEALMCNLPVVSTDVGDVSKLLQGVEPSAVCQADPSDLGTAVASILEAGHRCNGREQRRELSETVIADRILEIYDSAE
jgi:teichuronic acid biosynthesis glycosyltransferase TuaC